MSLGTWGLSGDAYGKIEAADAERVIARAVDVGITLFDTSDAYGLGRMEALLGKTLAPHKDVLIVTKGGTDRTTDPPRKHFEPEHLKASIERSLKRLGRERLDIYLLHNPSSDALALGEATDTLIELKKEGKIGVWGVSAGDAEVAKGALDKGCEVLELAYNLFHAIDLNRIAGDVMLSGAGLLAHSVLGYGLLAGLWTKEREFGEGDHRVDRWTRVELEKRVGQLDAVRFLVKGDVHSMRAAAVRFVLANSLISSAILGPHSVEQLEQLIRETGGGPVYLPDADLATLPRALGKIGILQ